MVGMGLKMYWEATQTVAGVAVPAKLDTIHRGPRMWLVQAEMAFPSIFPAQCHITLAEGEVQLKGLWVRGRPVDLEAVVQAEVIHRALGGAVVQMAPKILEVAGELLLKEAEASDMPEEEVLVS
jgi:hypothetical protein